MKVLRGTLTFVLGMIIGIILFVVAIGGTVVILATSMTVGDVQKSISGTEIISPDSEIYDKTVFDAVKGVIADVQSFDKLSLKTLYEHYGIQVLNGISGIDFTDKDFYDVPITELVNDLSIIVNSFSLRDVSKIAGVDFETYNLPILTDNLDNNVSTAIDNILGTLNGDITIRAIKNNFGLDIGIDDNALLSSLQDVKVSAFGSVIDAMRLNVLLDADTDTFVPTAGGDYYVKADRYEQVSAADLANASYVAPLGVQTYLAGGIDTDGDGKTDTMDMRETRFVKRTENVDGVQTEKYVVDNSCYAEGFDAAATDKTFYRHVEYVKTDSADGELYIMSYANHIDSTDGEAYVLVQKGFILLADAVGDGTIWGIDGEVDKNSKLEETDIALAQTYKRVHVGTSAAILQKIVYMSVGELQHADTMFDTLTVADMTEINDDSPKILKSLTARKTKIKELGNAMGNLPLGEMMNIISNRYVSDTNGRYVRIIDESVYTLYDEKRDEGLTRYKRNSDGTYTPNANGAFVHGVYYTLYNPAEHSDLVRYERKDDSDSSSTLLQRLGGSTLDNLPDAFDNLLISDLMSIDGDVYSVATPSYIENHISERYFYYDAEKRVYSIANEKYREEHRDTVYYHITHSGNSTSFIKKLAYVKVENMSDAMETVINDMFLSDIIEINDINALILDKATDTKYSASGEYFLEYDENSSHSGIDELGQYVYAYDSHGVYARSNFLFTLLPENDVNGYGEDDNTKYIYYTYKSYQELWDELDGNAVLYAEEIAELTSCGNLYYFDSKTSEYKRNLVLCTYLLNHSDSEGNSYRDKVFFRVKTDAAEADNETVFKGIMYTLKDGVSEPEYGIYVKDNFRGFLRYDSENPAFADKPLGTFVKSTVSTETELEYYILRDEIPFYALALKNQDFVTNTEIRYERRRCEYVYVLDENGDYVYIDGQYIEYDAQIHGDVEQRFVRKFGYIATANETYYTIQHTDGSELKVTDFTPQGINKYIRKKSEPIMRLLADNTLGDMTDVIAEAKVGDVIEAESGSLFALEEVRNANISEIGNVFSSILTDMTIGNLIKWSNVKDVNNNVKIALNDVSIDGLLHSLEYDEVRGTIVVNMLKLYGYEE